MSHDIQVSALAEDEEYPVEQDGYPSPTLRRKSLGLSRPKHRVSVITYREAVKVRQIDSSLYYKLQSILKTHV